MGKKKKNSNYKKNTETKEIAAAAKPKSKFQPMDLLCVLAALIFVGMRIYHQQVAEISMPVMAGLYIAIVALLGIYFFTSSKFRAIWNDWNTNIKLYLIILIVGDILAFVSYDIVGNLAYLAIFVAVNIIYYWLFLRHRTKAEEAERKAKLEKEKKKKNTDKTKIL